MDKKIVKQVAGIDVGQQELVVSAGSMSEDWVPNVLGYKTFANNAKGFDGLLKWINQLTDNTVPVRFVMEATGVYHESLAYFLSERGQEISIILPSKISNYQRTLSTKTITDKTSSECIALFGLERRLDCWQPPKPIFKTLRQLVRERNQLVATRTVIKNQLHAESAQAEPHGASVTRLKKQIGLFDKQEKEIKAEIAALIKSDATVNDKIQLICSAPGIGLLTAATILAETNGFELIRNKRQLSSYAGLDVKEKQSGTSVKGKPRISKKGNKHLRKTMHLPALAAIRHDDRFKAIFARLVAKHGIKMKAAVAVQRKLLELVYILYKTNQPYDINYLQNKIEKQAEVA